MADFLHDLLGNFEYLTWQMPVMWLIGGILIYLAIKKDMEPSLLLPMGFGAILVNLPVAPDAPAGMAGAIETLETLFNASATSGSYYKAKVNHDFYGAG